MSEQNKRIWTDLEKKAIEANPDLPEDIAAAFAKELLEIQEESGMTLSEILSPPLAPNLPSAEPGSIQELFPHLRDERFV